MCCKSIKLKRRVNEVFICEFFFCHSSQNYMTLMVVLCRLSMFVLLLSIQALSIFALYHVSALEALIIIHCVEI